MILTEIIGGIVTCVAVAGVVLNNRRDRRCFYLWVASNAASAGLHFAAGIFALAVRDCVFLALAIVGLRAWGRAGRAKPAWPAKPKIVCLCGSTRFGEAYRAANLSETLAGRIVLTVGCDTHSDEQLGLAPHIKAKLDELHLRKIDLADEVLILNVGGHVGPSTAREILYAIRAGKPVQWLDPENVPPLSEIETKAARAPVLTE